MRTPLHSLVATSLLLFGACSDDGTQKDSSVPDSGPPASCGTSAYLPADSAVGDFKQEAPPKAADTSKRLDDLINGDSTRYKRNNFKCMVQVVYASATRSYKIKVWLFDQTDYISALNVFIPAMPTNFTSISPAVGDDSHEDLTLPLEYVAVMYKGKYLARVMINSNTARDDGRAMIKAIAAKLP